VDDGCECVGRGCEYCEAWPKNRVLAAITQEGLDLRVIEPDGHDPNDDLDAWLYGDLWWYAGGWFYDFGASANE